ncbi:ABC transporter ATP-binding protein [Planctomicrobium sp. SH661]|uniref:ABC transporter ATP-binding protein n=1 Tax=Planctomicrobium sp. SH661 TaxID=3448124 RepID=UPI003F5C0D52
MINVRNVTKSFQSGTTQVNVLNGVTCDFPAGSFSFILGPSGSGKSTLLYLLGALDDPTSGEIQVDGQSLGNLSLRERDRFRRDQVGFIFQSFNLIKNLNALQNALVPFFATGCSPQLRARAEELLNRVGLKDRVHHRPSQLSGGEQQRVAIARAILKSPKLILADEPTGELDSHTGRLIFDLLRQLQEEQAVTVVTVTHDERYLTPADRVLRMENGLITSS